MEQVANSVKDNTSHTAKANELTQSTSTAATTGGEKTRLASWPSAPPMPPRRYSS
ncbi:hypothetical protein [Halomonas sp. MCCC 1A11062]|uniref:hypothetical protein n=1 Tax=Halomonas sp. MCCC 1A11062 TaxID=2733485 RepID=UPI001F359C6E|nr:hypothetical protein [Halomonas sp. MCCC 1A11062]MCE8039855.1 hypothetical protein [Halomonas sp. MCCC 1A11062]